MSIAGKTGVPMTVKSGTAHQGLDGFLQINIVYIVGGGDRFCIRNTPSPLYFYIICSFDHT